MASQYLRRLVADASWQASRPTLNQWLDGLLGNAPGYVNLVGDDGKRLDPRTGAALSTGNFALTINSAAAKHLALGPAGTVLVAQNTGITIGVPIALGGSAFTFTATSQRLIGDLTNATLANRLLAQTSTANSPSSWGVIPSGSGTVANLAAFNNAAPGSATAVAVLEGNSTSVQLRSDFLTGAGLPVDVYTNNTRQLRIDTAGLVSLTTALALGAVPASAGAIRLATAGAINERNHGNTADIALLSATASDQVLVGDGVNAPNTIVLAATDVRLRIAATDVAIFGATALTLPVGQIAFPSTQLPSAGVNVLDDYTEGTWTPTLGGTATYSAQVGTFIKIGRTVHVYCRFQVNAIGTGSTSTISGLPYAAAQRSAGYVSAATALAVAVTCLSIDIANGATTAQLNGLTAAATSYAAVAGFGAATAITFTATYITAN